MLDRFVDVTLWCIVALVVVRCARTLVRRARHPETIILGRRPFPRLSAALIAMLIVISLIDPTSHLGGPPYLAFLFAWLLMTIWHSLLGTSIDDGGIDAPLGIVPWRRVTYTDFVTATSGNAGRFDFGVKGMFFGGTGVSLPVRADVIERAQQLLARAKPAASGTA